jgi:hypothetical protein
MPSPIRPVTTCILRLWREPGAPKGDAGKRGIIRPLETKGTASDAVPFDGLENLLAAVRPALIADKPAAPTSSNAPAEATRVHQSGERGR